MPNRKRAKEVIEEIVRLYGGEVESKTHLFKVFYFAHLYYAQEAPSFLSDWPIVRMPAGPGIDRADSLLDELTSDGVLEKRLVPVGPYQAIRYRLVDRERKPSLSPDEIDAVRKAVEFIKGKSAAELSQITHDFSRSWNSSADGEELDVYVDLLTDEDYEASRQRVSALADFVRNA